MIRMLKGNLPSTSKWIQRALRQIQAPKAGFVYPCYMVHPAGLGTRRVVCLAQPVTFKVLGVLRVKPKSGE